MSDTLVKIDLYFLIISSVVFAVLHAVFWLRQRPQYGPDKRKLLWRNVFFLLSGLVGWYLFYSRLVSNGLVLALTMVMLVLSVFAAELLWRQRPQA